MLMTPVNARAANVCGTPVDGVVNCPSSDTNYPEGIHYIINPAEPQDLTVNLGDGMTIDTGSSGHTGIHVANLNGSVTINGSGSTIITSSTGAAGMFGVTSVGDLTMHAGDITTSGDQSDGIAASAAQGDVAITANAISTSGDLSDGIAVVADRYDGGNVSIDVQSISTAGDNSKGMDVLALGGNADISVGAVSTSGNGSTAIQAIVDGDVSIAADSITTSGFASHGIAALSVSGNVSIDAGTVYGYGSYSVGVYAISLSGDATVNTEKKVQTIGYHSDAIQVLAAGKATVNAHDIEAIGHYSSGITAVGASADVHVTGLLATQGYAANGITAIGQAGDVSIRADDTIVTRYAGSTAILGVANGNVTVDANTVYTNAFNSIAIVAVGYGGDVDVTANKVAGWGDGSGGILALAGPADAYDMTGHNVTVTAGLVTTEGSGQRASGIAAVNFTYGGNTTVTVTESVSTRRDYAPGVLAFSQGGTATINVKDASTRGFGATAINADGATAVVHAAGAISTLGDFSAGIRGYGATGGVTIVSSGSVSTSGHNSYGLLAHGFGPLSVTNSGDIETSGEFGHGIYAIVSPSATSSISILNSGDILTIGDKSDGIKAVSRGGGATVVSTGNVTVSGANSIGILAAGERGGRGEGREAEASLDKTVNVDAATVTATGDGSAGIVAVNYNGAVVVDSDKVEASGLGAIGISTISAGTTDINTNSITSSGMAINALSGGDVAISVGGAVTSSADSAIVATSMGGSATVNIGAGGSVIGGGHRVPVFVYGGNGITLASWYGTATVNNSGFVTTKGDGYAIEIIGFAYETERRSVINNSGRIDGAIHVTELDDKFINSGTFNVTKNSNFDLGNDLFNNTGTVKLMTGSAVNVSFQGLELFDNQGGKIDLTNGHTGDVFILPGNYIGSGDALLALDVKGLEADNFVVSGTATGKTKVALANLGAGEATLTGEEPIVIIRTGAGSQAGAFELASSNIGFIQYGLAYDAKAGTYGLVGTVGSAVYRSAKIGEGLQSVWHKSADAWGAHMSGLRDAGTAKLDHRLWGQLFGQVDKRDEKRINALVGGEETYDLGYHQTYYGGQLGYDFGKGGAFSWGLMAGYAGSKLDYTGRGESINYDVVNLGAYAGYTSGRLFANALLKYDHSSIKVSSEALEYSNHFDGGSFGASIEAGARFGSDRFFVEPLAGLSWLSTSIDNLEALGQTIDFDRVGGFRGKIGARIGGVRKNGDGSVLTVYGGASLVHEFEGEDGVTLKSGGTTDHADNKRIGTHGQGTIGLNLQSSGGISGFIEANGQLGGGYKSAGGRVGLRIKL